MFTFLFLCALAPSPSRASSAALTDPSAIMGVVDEYVLARPKSGYYEVNTPALKLYHAVYRLGVIGRPAPPVAPHLLSAFGRLTSHALRGSAEQAVMLRRDWHLVGAGRIKFYHEDLRVFLALTPSVPGDLTSPVELAAVSLLEWIASAGADERVRAAADLALQHVFSTLADLAMNTDERIPNDAFDQRARLRKQAIEWLGQSSHPAAEGALRSIADASRSAPASPADLSGAWAARERARAELRGITCALDLSRAVPPAGPW